MQKIRLEPPFLLLEQGARLTGGKSPNPPRKDKEPPFGPSQAGSIGSSS